MKPAHSLQAALLAVALITAGVGAAAGAPRDVLWVALQGCILAKKTTGGAFPCLSVDLGDGARPGTAVLRAPGQRTHLVVMPTASVVGLEAPELQTSTGNAYWRAALTARSTVTEVLKGELPIDDVGLAVNSTSGRSQDQLHIHVDCLKPSIQVALQRYAQGIRRAWTRLPMIVQGSPLYAMRVEAPDVQIFNPFAELTKLPGSSGSLSDVTFAAVSATNGVRGDLYLLAYRQKYSAAEKVLDHSCSLTKRTAMQ
ncbi:CDP-diacylglycerol diphosphatase [Methylobacterium sp. 4-46]|uniref:CDP-diacylglycerol diphosphatase n=1 Tax=unclassified Methylobacterium TaxID=2615210 RepID=UPI000152D76C|nr:MULTISPECIES: CDP-diacylglycerol diphosphatase [Methylobacterium]ACA17746.1 CDP-diacylglycerol diphosphatase [Methylobacterium sp. 4-46]WFT83415.1 CDP-diacylglycerol diphosphatase [Methylobacterium nodulans]